MARAVGVQPCVTATTVFVQVVVAARAAAPASDNEIEAVEADGRSCATATSVVIVAVAASVAAGRAPVAAVVPAHPRKVSAVVLAVVPLRSALTNAHRDDLAGEDL